MSPSKRALSKAGAVKMQAAAAFGAEEDFKGQILSLDGAILVIIGSTIKGERRRKNEVSSQSREFFPKFEKMPLRNSEMRGGKCRAHISRKRKL